jgi:hypothetical protein
MLPPTKEESPNNLISFIFSLKSVNTLDYGHKEEKISSKFGRELGVSG